MKQGLYIYLRKKRDQIFDPIVKSLHKAGVKANWLSYTGIVIAFVVYYIADKSLLAAMLVMLLAKIFDMLDGPLARHAGHTTKHGATTDIVCDQIVFFIAMLALIKIGLINVLLGGTLIFLIFTSKILRSVYNKTYQQFENKYKDLLLPIIVTAIPYFTAIFYYITGIPNYDVLLGCLAIVLLFDIVYYLYKIVFTTSSHK